MLSVDEAWSLWRKTFDEICQVHAPMKIIRVRNRYNPWMSPEILSLMYKRDHVRIPTILTYQQYSPQGRL